MENKELIQIYKVFSKQLVNHNFDIINDDEFEIIKKSFKKNIKNLFKMLKEYFSIIDFKRFSSSELKELGFSFWDDQLLLAPAWVIVSCKDGTIFTSINSDTKIKGVDVIDTDTRFGCTAYGFLLSELRDRKIENILTCNDLPIQMIDSMTKNMVIE